MVTPQVDPPLTEKERAAKHMVICVTGATSYVGSPIVYRLLSAGHTVHAPVRKPDDPEKVKYLKALPNAAEKLKLFKAELLEEGSYDEAVKGCDAVIHTASPYILAVPSGKEREMLIDPALKGTENVLGSVDRSPSVKRVVLTSSVAAVYADPDERGKGHVFNDTDFGIKDSETCLPYFHSKKLAEQRAWELCKQQTRWGLVTVCPGQVWGPPLSPNKGSSPSINMMVAMLSGKMWPFAAPIGFGFVDVRDVALTHVLALVTPEAKGRYIAVSETKTFVELAAILSKHYPQAWLPKLAMPYYALLAIGPFLGQPRDLTRLGYGKKPVFDTSRAKALGVNFLSTDRMAVDEAERLFELGFVSRPGK